MTDFKSTAYSTLNTGMVSFQKEVQVHIPMISVVIPISRGEHTLEGLVDEISNLNVATNKQLKITEIILVWDGAEDNSATVMHRLAVKNPLVKAVWLSRNFGQHAATLAGIARSRGDWIVTLDESGIHAPAEIGNLVATALDGNHQLVYGIDSNQVGNRTLRSALNFLTIRLFKHQTENQKTNEFSNFRLIRGDVARSLSAHCNFGVYLDIALQWVTHTSKSYPIHLRTDYYSNQNPKHSRFSHRYHPTAQTYPRMHLGAVSLIGVFTILLSFGLLGNTLYQNLAHGIHLEEWKALCILFSFLFGVALISIGILIDYFGTLLKISMGKPAYLTQSKPPISER